MLPVLLCVHITGVQFYSTHSEELSVPLSNAVVKRGSLEYHVKTDQLKKSESPYKEHDLYILML